jgi:hypothetical protein
MNPRKVACDLANDNGGPRAMIDALAMHEQVRQTESANTVRDWEEIILILEGSAEVVA